MNSRLVHTATLAAVADTTVHAQALPKAHLKIVGGLSNFSHPTRTGHVRP